jgi:hypothetical protein
MALHETGRPTTPDQGQEVLVQAVLMARRRSPGDGERGTYKASMETIL